MALMSGGVGTTVDWLLLLRYTVDVPTSPVAILYVETETRWYQELS